jgi:hypothetical protein
MRHLSIPLEDLFCRASSRDRDAACRVFVQGAGGDVKPFPCDPLDLAEKYGKLLAVTVEHQINDLSMVAVGGALIRDFATVPLAFAPPPTRDQLNQKLKSGSLLERRQAARMLAILYRDGLLPYDYP